MKKILRLAVLVVVILVVSVTGYSYNMLPEFMDNLKAKIITQVDNSLNGALNFDEVRLSGFMKLSFYNVVLHDKAGKLVFSAPEVIVTVDTLSLALNFSEPTKVISNVAISKGSQLFLVADENNSWNINNLVKPSDEEKTPFYANINLENLHLVVQEPQEKWDLDVKGDINAKNNPNFVFDLDLKHEMNNIKTVGNFTTDGDLKVKIVADSLKVEPYAKFVERLTTIKSLQGTVNDVNIIWENKGGENVFNGGIKVADVKGVYSQDDINVQGLFNGNLNVSNNKMQFSSFNVILNGQQLDIAGGLELKQGFLVTDNFSIKSRDFDPFIVYAKSPWQGGLALNLLFDGILDEELRAVLISGDIHFASGKVNDILINDGVLTFSYKDAHFLLQEAKAKVLGGNIEAIGQYDHNLKDIAGSVNVKELDLAQLPNESGFGGKLNGNVTIAGKVTTQDLSVTADVYSEQLVLKGIALNDLTVRIVRADGKTELQYADAKIGAGSVTAHGVIDGAPLDILVQAGDIPLSTVLPAVGLQGYGLLTARADLFGSLDNLSGNISLEASEAVVAQQPLRLLQANFTLANGLLVVDNFLAQMNYGIHVVHGFIDIMSPEQAVDLQVISQNVRLEPLAAIAFPEQRITGNMDNVLFVTGTVKNPLIKGDILMTEGSYEGQFVELVKGRYEYSDDILSLHDFNIVIMQTKLLLNGYLHSSGELNFEINGDNVRVESFPQLEEVNAYGGINLHGLLTGSIDKPMFNGTVKSDSVTINGQELRNINGEAWSEGGIQNYLRINFAQSEGTYYLDAGLNISERFMSGTLEVNNGDVKSLLAVGGQKLNVDGRLNGNIELNSGGRRTGMKIDAQIIDGSIGKVPLEKVDVGLHIHKGKITVQRFEGQQGSGKILGTGVADLNGEINLEFGGNNLDASLLTALMDRPIEVKGNLSFLVQATGTAEKPIVSASLNVSPGIIENVTFDNFYGLFSMKEDQFSIDQLFIEKDVYKMSAYGTVPVDLLRAKENRKNPNAQMDVVLRFDNADLSIIPSVFGTQVDWGMGETKGNLNVKGTLEKPSLYGEVKILDGALKFKQLRNPLEKINLSVVFDNDKITLDKFNANMGNGTINALGNFDINDVASKNNYISIKTDKLALASDIVTGEVTTDLLISPYNFRGELIPKLSGDVLLENFLVNLPVVPDFGEGSSNIVLDVVVHTGKNVRLYNKYLYDMILEGNLHIKGGTDYPVISGSANVLRGTIKYLGTPFRIDSAQASFPIAGTFVPQINLSANSRMSSYNVNINITGPLTEMDVRLSSDPPLSQQEIFRLMTLKTLSSDSENVSGMSDDDVRNLLTAGLQMTFLGDIEDFFRSTGTLDEFRIYQGDLTAGSSMFVSSRTLSKSKDSTTQYNVYLSKYLSRRVLLSYTASLDNENRIVSLQYELGRKFKLSASMDEDENLFYGLEYRISF